MQVCEGVFSYHLRTFTWPLNYSRARWDSRSIKQKVIFFSSFLSSFGCRKCPVYRLGCGIESFIIFERSFHGGINDSVLCRCFQGQLGLKEKRVAEGIEERKETGVLLGRRENLALVLAPAHGVEPVERRFGPFLYSTLMVDAILVLDK